MSPRMYLWGLSLLPHVGSITAKRLINVLGSEAKAFWANTRELCAAGGLSFNNAKEVVSAREQLDLALKWKVLNEEFIGGKNNKGLITWLDRDYPPLLHEIPDPPLVLYFWGKLECLTRPTIAIVGRRKASPRGIGWAKRLGRELASFGITIVSGLALGVDAAAHAGALETGMTAAILGSGLDRIYPRANNRLARAIPKKGVLISPFPSGTPPLRGNFPARNRIISGLSRGVIVVEAGERSGSLITASLAVEQNRDVYAVPGDPLDVGASGPNRLIQDGAKLIFGAEDVLEEMYLSRQLKLPISQEHGKTAPSEASGISKLDKSLGRLLNCLDGPLHLDEIAVKTNLPAADVTSGLIQLELKGLVEELTKGVFQRIG